MHHPDNSRPIVLDTLGKLADHGHGMGGWCRACAATSRKELLPLIERPAFFSVDLGAVMAARGTDSPVAWMRPLACPGCGGRETEIRVTAPSKGGG
jgi:hypothetical protein